MNQSNFFYKIIINFSDKNFKPLPVKTTIYHIQNFIQIIKNLYNLLEVPEEVLNSLNNIKLTNENNVKKSLNEFNAQHMFALKVPKLNDNEEIEEVSISPLGYSINDYVWTKDVSEQFKKHKFNRSFFNELKNPKSKCHEFYYVHWALNYKPLQLNEIIYETILDITEIFDNYYLNSKDNILDIYSDKYLILMIKEYLNSESFRNHIQKYVKLKDNLKNFQ